jgi:hypothetical protein
VSRHLERLACRLCGAALLVFDGTGRVGPELLGQWREALAEHRPDCAGPSPISAPPLAVR